MKTLLIMFIVGICAIGWRSPEIMHAIGMAGSAQDPASISLTSLNAGQAQAQQKSISVDEFAALSKTDPQAYQKFIGSYQVEEDRSEVDKLMNFFTRGRYE